jgi:low temperature requirement protein LtrA
MGARTIDEANRTATPLELLLDLTFVIAVAQLAARLAHVTADDHAPSAVGRRAVPDGVLRDPGAPG